MSAIALLMGLLVLSYLGTLLVNLGKTRGLPSGIEFIVLGFAVGPHALGVLELKVIDEFEPLVQVALGWLAFVVGLDFGRVEGRRVKQASTALGIVCALVTGGVVAFAVYYAAPRLALPGIEGQKSRLLLAAGAGAVSAETARYAVEWVQARWGAKGPISRLLVDIGAADDLAPLVAAGAIFALSPAAGIAVTLPASGWFLASFALGAGLGIVTAVLLRGAEGDAVWGAVIGTILLGVGAAARFGLSTIFVTFVMGIALAAASPARTALRHLVRPTERAVLYPMLLLAGARVDVRPLVEHRSLAALVALVLCARIAGKLVSGLLVRASTAVAKPAGPLLGIVLLSSGPVSTACGLAFALRFPGPLGDTLLVAAVASAALGELVSTLSLRALLVEAGEIAPASVAAAPSIPPPPPSVRPPERATHPPPPPPSSTRLPVAAVADELGDPNDEP
ncbi:MAG: cation:proton antiporter [Labilithrix sp.]|nr:cation:proton antiporter [Labilithrix sp.]MCW5816399.1 cation:proton antiporter [Labilithrix sp.]